MSVDWNGGRNSMPLGQENTGSEPLSNPLRCGGCRGHPQADLYDRLIPVFWLPGDLLARKVGRLT